ncbi:MAG: 3-methyladenine DNA glycosylase AlkC [Flavobacteriales bacterium]|jgi:3-methyladenine DNA glycosylase AlkC
MESIRHWQFGMDTLKIYSMSTLFKDVINKEFFKKITPFIREVYPPFDGEKFIKDIFCNEWKDFELKQRTKHTTLTLAKHFPSDFIASAEILKLLVQNKEMQGDQLNELACLFIPDFIAEYGMNHIEKSLDALEVITPVATAEFAIRPFIIAHEKMVMKRIMNWATHPNQHVRRLASEGSRSRLPWGMAIPSFKNNPSPLLPLLELLKNDESEYVRRSVANNINDITKDNPEVSLAIANKWIGETENTDKLIKHALRTLLKRGNKEALALFDLGYDTSLKVTEAKLLTPKVRVGESAEMQFTFMNSSTKKRNVRMEYAIYFLLNNGKYGKKIFKISERKFDVKEQKVVTKMHSFRVITTRTFYPGIHKIAPVINGFEFPDFEFELI